MRMDLEMNHVINQYGQTITLFPCEGGEPIVTRAFMQIEGERSEQFLPTPLGVLEREQVNYYGYGNLEIECEMTALWNGEEFVFIRAAPVFSGDKICYYRGILRRKGGDYGGG